MGCRRRSLTSRWRAFHGGVGSRLLAATADLSPVAVRTHDRCALQLYVRERLPEEATRHALERLRAAAGARAPRRRAIVRVEAMTRSELLADSKAMAAGRSLTSPVRPCEGTWQF